jgi:hypothetical protein
MGNPDEAAIDPEANLPAKERTLKLTPSERHEIARFLVELLIEHNAACKSRWERSRMPTRCFPILHGRDQSRTPLGGWSRGLHPLDGFQHPSLAGPDHAAQSNPD